MASKIHAQLDAKDGIDANLRNKKEEDTQIQDKLFKTFENYRSDRTDLTRTKPPDRPSGYSERSRG